MASSTPATPDTLVTLKVNFQGSTRRFKLPLRDLGATSLEDKVRHAIYQRRRHLHRRFRLIVPTPLPHPPGRHRMLAITTGQSNKDLLLLFAIILTRDDLHTDGSA